MKSEKKSGQKLTALITGASSGLGESIAKNCASRGIDLLLVSENAKELNRVRQEIKKGFHCSVTGVVMNLFAPDSAGRLFDLCRRRGQRVDILANCAGIYLNIDREMREVECIDDILNLHIFSLTKLCFLFGRTMIKQKLGYILNVSSIAAGFPDPASLTYGPTKRYVRSLSEALHCEWKPHNVRVTCLTPGSINTNFFKANGVFVPPIIRSTMISPEKCAEIGLNAMFKGKRRITPGISGKLQAVLLRAISRPATYEIIKKSYFSMKQKS
jgi:short-subunit dehydrogenase